MDGPHDSTTDQGEVPATTVSSSADGDVASEATSRTESNVDGAVPPLPHDGAPDSDGAESTDIFLGMSAGDRVFTLTCVVLGCLLLLVHWARQEGAGLEPVEIERLDPAAYNYRVDANTATWVEFMLLEGIGEQLARRIVADREQHGPFVTVDDLERVRGIGPKTLAGIRPGLQCLPPESSRREETP